MPHRVNLPISATALKMRLLYFLKEPCSLPTKIALSILLTIKCIPRWLYFLELHVARVELATKSGPPRKKMTRRSRNQVIRPTLPVSQFYIVV